MMRHLPTLVGALLVSFVLANPESATAQVALGPVASVDLQAPPELADSRTHIHAGIALVVSGLATSAVGAGLNFGMGGIIGLAGGGTLMGVGSLLLFSGIPTWIVGGVRDDLLRSGQHRAEAAARWELAGVLVFCISMAIAALGAGLVGTSFPQGSLDEAQLIAGSTMLTAGVTVATFIALPMWAEGARF